MKKRNADNKWLLQAKHPGQVHIQIEIPGKSNRCNTLRTLRVLKHFSL